MANYLNVDKMLESSLGLDEFGIGQLRSIEWSRKYLWSFGFVDLKDPNTRGDAGPKKPFNSFFPCVDVDETITTLNTFQGEAYMTNFKVPQSGDIKSLKVTFLDDQENSLYNFFQNWINTEILNNGRYVSPLEECVKAVKLNKLKLASIGEIIQEVGSLAGFTNEENSIQNSNTYWVFPEGAITYNGGSSSEVNIYSVDLVIAGVVDLNKADGGLSDTIANVARSLGASAVLGGVGRILG